MKFNMRFDRPTTVFFAIALVAVGFVALPMWNYTKFYGALWSFNYTLLNITVDTQQAMNIQVDIELQVANPTDYSGLEIEMMMCGIDYVNPAQPHLVWDRSLPGHWGGDWRTSYVWQAISKTISLNHRLPVYANETIVLTFIITPEAGTEREKDLAMKFIGFVQSDPKEINWGINCHLVLSSFLNNFIVSRYFDKTTYP